MEYCVLLLVAPLLFAATAVCQCPEACRCHWVYQNQTAQHYLTNCQHAGLTELPGNISALTTHLDLSFNQLVSVPSSGIRHLVRLQHLDTRENPELRSLPAEVDLHNLTAIYTDTGYSCCIYETEREEYAGSEARKEAQSVCKPTEPYTECQDNLLSVMSLVINSITTILSVIFNPWVGTSLRPTGWVKLTPPAQLGLCTVLMCLQVMLVTVGLRPRRKDPILMNHFHFCCSNVLITIYAAVMFGYGCAYYGSYPYHMESWLHNAGCSAIGYMLISGMLAEQFFWTIEVTAIYMKLRHPLNVERHVTGRHLCIYVGVSWALSFFIASIPFMAHDGYNQVGTCLPFYSKSFRYVILYTVVTNIMLAVNVSLAVILMRSFIKDRKERQGEIPAIIVRETKKVQKMILIMITVYLILDIVLVAFLIMSCVDGPAGAVGREWFARLCVLSAILEPLAGPARSKRFYKDTRRLQQRWQCYTPKPSSPKESSFQGIKLQSKEPGVSTV